MFTDVDELVAEVADYVAHHNTDPKPFIWTKSARGIFQKVIRANCHLSFKKNATLREPLTRARAFVARESAPLAVR